MTGFGKAVGENDLVILTVEIKSVNSRFLDSSFKLPREYNQFEADLRDLISQSIQRGRVDVYVNRQPKKDADLYVYFNRKAFDAYWEIYGNLADELSCDGRTVMLCDVLGRREVLTATEIPGDPESEKGILMSTVSEALDKLTVMRAREGLKLSKDLIKRFEALSGHSEKIAELTNDVTFALKDKLLQRLTKLSLAADPEPGRLEQELAFVVDKLDITEELVRLRSHIQELNATIKASPGGRKLEFLTQECLRELNTIGSKAQNAKVQSIVVDAKCVLEKIREQVQNIE
ncbi:MAG: YicC family protein [Candidatus Dadabacteria bacterium]|nr:MAG: YicC family protein [Candidatus Dadabacteria bacterium]